MNQVSAIGMVHSPLKRLADCPLQEIENAPQVTIEIFSKWVEAASDLKVGDDIILLTWLDKADRSVLKTFPRNDTDSPFTGVFSTRSPDRPNPIGMHQVRIMQVLSDREYVVSGMEVLDKTPLIDIKPRL